MNRKVDSYFYIHLYTVHKKEVFAQLNPLKKHCRIVDFSQPQENLNLKRGC